jgi:LEA14-like dessication related protein
MEELIKQTIKQIEEAKANNREKLVIDVDLKEYEIPLFVKNIRSLGYVSTSIFQNKIVFDTTKL